MVALSPTVRVDRPVSSQVGVDAGEVGVCCARRGGGRRLTLARPGPAGLWAGPPGGGRPAQSGIPEGGGEGNRRSSRGARPEARKPAAAGCRRGDRAGIRAPAEAPRPDGTLYGERRAGKTAALASPEGAAGR